MKFNFPIIQNVEIKSFSLYKKKDHIDLNLQSGVFCLAGANGLGKSTFLNLINYAVTGIVVDPKRDFGSVVSTSRFYNYNKKFASIYFDGRVDEIDRDDCSIKLVFKVGENTYLVERGLFQVDELINFERIIDGENTVESNLNANELFKKYCEYLTRDVGLSAFDQYVFLQYFVLSFDEHHNLIFWSPELMESSLYLIFGVDVNEAKRANELRRSIKAYGSNIRNYTYHKNRLVKDFNALQHNILDQKGFDLADGIEEEYDILIDQIEGLEKSLYTAKGEISQAEFKISEHSLNMNDLKSQYQNIFNGLFATSGSDDLFKDVKIRSLFDEFRSAVCNDLDSSDIIQLIAVRVKNNYCINKPDSDDQYEQLKKIDLQILDEDKIINANRERKQRLLNEVIINEKNLLEIQERIRDIETNFGTVIKQIKDSAKNDFSGLIDAYNQQIEDKESEILTIKKQKIDLEKELKILERSLNKTYAKAEKEFIPIFNKYANNFLGLQVDLKLQNSNKGTMLILIIEDVERSDFFQLSESQRYFIDIALRMAFIEFSCEKATLLIDTPEGSLDIAYESTAGQMFGDFASLGYNLIMTANINTSELLIELAKKCSNSMSIERMTEWTYLSDVQVREEKKIISAYNKIEAELNKNNII